MKANQKFVEADDAVSPVIGVILMVAITVVLAAVVFVLVQGLGDTGDSAPDVSFTKDEADDRFSVAKAEAGVDWGDFSFRANAAVKYALNGAAGTGSDALGGNTTTASAVSGTMTAGDFIEICGDGAGLSNVEFTIIHEASNSQIGTFTYSSVAVCA